MRNKGVPLHLTEIQRGMDKESRIRIHGTKRKYCRGIRKLKAKVKFFRMILMK